MQEIDEWDAKADWDNEMLMDALEGELATQPCSHGPERLLMIGEDYEDDIVRHHFHCECGRNIDRVFRLIGTQITD